VGGWVRFWKVLGIFSVGYFGGAFELRMQRHLQKTPETNMEKTNSGFFWDCLETPP
jgi:hypothetical protein